MDGDHDKTAKQVEAELEDARRHSDALGKALDEAERRHPPDAGEAEDTDLPEG